MDTFRIALANVRSGSTPQDAVSIAEQAIAEAGRQHAEIVCFPETYIPGYRLGRTLPAPDNRFLENAWATVANAARAAKVTVILGTERVVHDKPTITALVIDKAGQTEGFQDKVQLDPSEDSIYSPGCGRHTFRSGPLTFGIVICHEGWRYPETVRWAVRHGAQVVFHPHFHPDPSINPPPHFAHFTNTFHEKAALCRAAENTCFFATVNAAGAGSETTSAVVRPDGTLLAWQPYGQEGLLIADLDLGEATGLLAQRFKPEGLICHHFS